MSTSDWDTDHDGVLQTALQRRDSLSGEAVGEYVIDRLIAQGGCGAVYLARHGSLDRRAAIKVLHAALASSPRMVERFVREVEVVNLLRHPNIVEIYELGQLSDGRPFYAMEYLAGMTVDALLQARGRLSPAEALDILEPVSAALEAAHEAGIIHRDVKASNISIRTEGGRRTVKLLDFGIAKLATAELGTSGFTSAGRQIGTPSAMAPEQILGEPIDARIDVYALGILLYRLLTGRLPFLSSNHGELARLHLEEPAPLPSLLTNGSPALDAVVVRCLEKRPERRFDSAMSFVVALREAVGRPRAPGDEARLDTSVPAIGIALELRLEVAADDLDDALSDDLGTVLDLAEERLRRAGFLLTLVTGSAILAVKPLSGEPEAVSGDRRAGLEMAEALFDELVRRPGADDRIHPTLCVHVALATLRRSPRSEVVGGEIVRTSAWAPPPGVRGLCATAQALDGVRDVDVTEGPGSLFRIACLPAQPRREAATGDARAVTADRP